MLSLEIIRLFLDKPITTILYENGINRQTYYNILRSPHKASESTITKLSYALNAPYLPILIYLDMLHHCGAVIFTMRLPDTVPDAVQKVIYENHPVFNPPAAVNTVYKYSRQKGQNQ